MDPHPPDNELLISAYLDGELTPEEQARIEDELIDNLASRKTFGEMKALREVLQGLPRERIGRDVSAEILKRAEEAMLAGETFETKPNRGNKPVGPKTKHVEPVSPPRLRDRSDGSAGRFVAVMATTAALLLVAAIVVTSLLPGGLPVALGPSGGEKDAAPPSATAETGGATAREIDADKESRAVAAAPPRERAKKLDGGYGEFAETPAESDADMVDAPGFVAPAVESPASPGPPADAMRSSVAGAAGGLPGGEGLRDPGPASVRRAMADTSDESGEAAAGLAFDATAGAAGGPGGGGAAPATVPANQPSQAVPAQPLLVVNLQIAGADTHYCAFEDTLSRNRIVIGQPLKNGRGAESSRSERDAAAEEPVVAYRAGGDAVDDFVQDTNADGGPKAAAKPGGEASEGEAAGERGQAKAPDDATREGRYEYFVLEAPPDRLASLLADFANQTHGVTIESVEPQLAPQYGQQAAVPELGAELQRFVDASRLESPPPQDPRQPASESSDEETAQRAKPERSFTVDEPPAPTAPRPAADEPLGWVDGIARRLPTARGQQEALEQAPLAPQNANLAALQRQAAVELADLPGKTSDKRAEAKLRALEKDGRSHDLKPKEMEESAAEPAANLAEEKTAGGSVAASPPREADARDVAASDDRGGAGEKSGDPASLRKSRGRESNSFRRNAPPTDTPLVRALFVVQHGAANGPLGSFETGREAAAGIHAAAEVDSAEAPAAASGATER